MTEKLNIHIYICFSIPDDMWMFLHSKYNKFIENIQNIEKQYHIFALNIEKAQMTAIYNLHKHLLGWKFESYNDKMINSGSHIKSY